MTATLKIRADHDPESPRSTWDNLGTMVCWHKQYNLGDEQPKQNPVEFYAELPKGSLVLPLYLFDHSGITMRCESFSDPWDSGQVGYIYVTPDKIREEYSCKRITKKIREKVESVVRCEVKTYDNFLTNNVWGFVFEDTEKDVDDSCWGFYGEDLKDTGIAESIPEEAKPLLDAAWENRFDGDACSSCGHVTH